MKRILTLLACAVLLLSGCGKEMIANETTTSPTEREEVLHYPGDVANGKIPKYADLLPDEVFTTTGEENGLTGNLYMLLGTVKRYVEKPEGYPIYIEVSTMDGDVVIMDPVEFMKYDTASNTMLTDAGLEKLREFYPLPDVGEFVVIFAEYQGMSELFECPAFIYGTSSYMLEAILGVAMAGDGYLKEGVVDDPDETAPESQLAQTNPPVTTPSATETPATTPSVEEPIASGKAAALEKARHYLKSMVFSRTGLIGQLEYEGVSTEDATYAVDQCGADWNAQAAKRAKSYLDDIAFSYTGLIDQLEYEGFTHGQATYGADNSGADWNEQAKLKAAEYLSNMTFTRDGLIAQLEYEGFTYEQAVYGVEANGL